MSQACSISVRRAYGLQRVCRVWEQPRSTVYARRSASRRSAPSRRRGMELFMGENDNDGQLAGQEGAMCAACHIADWTAAADYALPVQVPAWAPDGMVPPVFTDFTFDNLGVPQNTEYPLPAMAPPDLGLGPIAGDPGENGKFKVMPVRNIGLSAPYAHNGLFKKLKDIVHFYNTRDVPGANPGGEDWPPPEYPATVNHDELGNLGLSDDDEDALVEFMKTRTWRRPATAGSHRARQSG